MSESREHHTASAAQILFAPFLLPGALGLDHFEEKGALSLAKETNTSLARPTPIDRAIIGPDLLKLCTEMGSIFLRVYLSSTGIGVLRIDWPAQDLGNDPKELLKIRRERHKEIIDGTSSLGARAHTLVNSITDFCELRHRFSPLAYNSARPFDYVFSMFEIDADARVGGNVALAEAALLTPSTFGISDTTWAPELSVDIPVTQGMNCANCETTDLLTCRASWASVVIVGRDCHEHRELYSALEMRTQALWLFAHRVGRVPPADGVATLLQLELLATSFEYACRAFFTLDDPTANERIMQLHAALVSSSGLRGKVEAARQNIKMLRGIASAREVRRREQFESVTQVLLFLIASLQLLPVVIQVPLVGIARHFMMGLWIVAALAFIAIRFRARRWQWRD